jgi:hypothetical protein
MIIETVRMQIKGLSFSQECDDEYESVEELTSTLSEIDFALDHLYLVHPTDSGEIKEFKKQNKKGNWFVIYLSSDLDILKNITFSDREWKISYPISNPANDEIKDRFKVFYEELAKIDTAAQTAEIKALIKKHLDPEWECTPEIEQDLAYIRIWQTTNPNGDWSQLPRFIKKDKQEIHNLNIYLKKWFANLWQEERERINHTYVGHYLSALICRDKFKQLCVNQEFSAKEIQDVIDNFKDIKQRIESLLANAIPYAAEGDEIASLSHLYRSSLDDDNLARIFAEQEEEYKTRCSAAIEPKVKITQQALTEVSEYIFQLEQSSEEIDEVFIKAFQKAVDELSESLREFKHIECDLHEYE